MTRTLGISFNLINFQCFLFTLSFLFGPKIAFVDLSILMPISILLLLGKTSLALKYSKKILLAAGLIALLLVYQAIIQVLYQVNELEPLLRLIRAALVCVVAAMVVGESSFSSKQLINALFYSLLFHAILIDIAAMIDPLNELLSIVSGNDRWKPLRSSGLLAGFDIAGLLCIIGALMLALKIFDCKSNLALYFYFFIFALAGFFTSRVSIALFSILIVLATFIKLFKSNLNVYLKYFIFSAIFTFFSYITYYYLLPIIEVTFSLGLIDVSDELLFQIISRHAVQTDSQFLWSDMFFLPGTISGILFGIGVDALNSDVGYIKDIFRYGLLGTIFSYIVYYYLYKMSVARFRIFKSSNYLIFVNMIFSLSFILSLKNSYFFTRGIFPIIILLVCISLIDFQDSDETPLL